MALFEFRLPDIGEGVAEGEVVAWHVEPGQIVGEDQEMVEVMTDKATVTIGAPKAGRIARLNGKLGEKIKVGSVLVVIDTEPKSDASERSLRPSRPPDSDKAVSRFQAPAGSRHVAEVRHPVRAVQGSVSKAPSGEGDSVASAVGDIRDSLPGSSFFAKAKGAPPASPTEGRARPNPDPSLILPGPLHPSIAFPSPFFAGEAPRAGAHFTDKPLATPATRKLARDLGVDLRCVTPTGPGSRVTKEDVRAYGGSVEKRSSGEPQRTRAAGDGTLEERRPFVGLRRRIAERMQLAKRTAAHFTFVEEVEVDELKRVIERLRPAAEQRGVKLNYLPFIVKAVTLALQKHPILNSMLDEQTNELVYRRYYHIGVAAATEQGLVVPVVRDADAKSLLEISQEIQRLAEGARTQKLTAHELSGSTFTVTSLGKQGGLLATPVLNHPEVGILGVHRVKEKPVVRGGQIVIGHVMMLSLSFDHRIVDGHVGAAFAYDVIAYLEKPELLYLEI